MMYLFLIVASSVLSLKSMRVEDVVVDVAPGLSKTPAGASAQLTTGKSERVLQDTLKSGRDVEENYS